MFPVSDDNPTLRTPVVTYALLAVTLLVWLVGEGGGGLLSGDAYRMAMSVCNYGLVPGELTGRVPVGFALPMGPGLACLVDRDPINWLTPVISIFLHGGWMHLIGNSLYLWVFGNNVEDSMGRGRFLAFYLICGVAAAAAHVLVSPSSPVPTVGASGAISGVLGAYLVLYPRVRVRIFIPPFFLFRVTAWLMLVWWFVTQVVTGLPELSPLRRDISGGVAVWAHVGGFLTGALLVKLFENRTLVRRRTVGGDARAAFETGQG
jgi:membrane associated rhomboid family serine protease